MGTHPLLEEANDTVGICGALDATAEVVMAEGDPSQAAELLKDAVKLAKNTKMQARAGELAGRRLIWGICWGGF